MNNNDNNSSNTIVGGRGGEKDRFGTAIEPHQGRAYGPEFAQHERRKVIRRNDGDLGGWLHAEGRVYVSLRERAVSNEGRPPCRRNADGPEYILHVYNTYVRVCVCVCVCV